MCTYIITLQTEARLHVGLTAPHTPGAAGARGSWLGLCLFPSGNPSQNVHVSHPCTQPWQEIVSILPASQGTLHHQKEHRWLPNRSRSIITVVGSPDHEVLWSRLCEYVNKRHRGGTLLDQRKYKKMLFVLFSYLVFPLYFFPRFLHNHCLSLGVLSFIGYLFFKMHLIIVVHCTSGVTVFTIQWINSCARSTLCRPVSGSILCIEA